MEKTWELRFDAGSSLTMPLPLQRENTYLQRLLKEHCSGPYDALGTEIGIDAVLEEDCGPANPRVGIKRIPLANGFAFAEINIGKAQWAVPLAEYKKFLWASVEKAIWICVEEIKKKTQVNEDLLRGHLSSAKAEFLSEAVLSPEDFGQRVVVQYQMNDQDAVWDFDGKVRLERLLTECLCAPRLGFCDCVDFEATKVNAICQVSNSTMAVEAIVRALRSHNRLRGAVIAEAGPGGERVVWPPNFSGEFSYL